MTATLSVPEAVRDRLKLFGHKGETYADILSRMMDRIDRTEFVRELRKQYAETPRDAYTDLDDL